MKRVLIITTMFFVSVTIFGLDTSSSLNNNPKKRTASTNMEVSLDSLNLLAEAASKRKYIGNLENNPREKSLKEIQDSDVTDVIRRNNRKEREGISELVRKVDSFLMEQLDRNEEINLVNQLTKEVIYLSENQEVYENAVKRLNSEIKKLSEEKEKYKKMIRILNANIENLVKNQLMLQMVTHGLNKEITNLKDENKTLFYDCKVQSQQIEDLKEKNMKGQVSVNMLIDDVTKLSNNNNNLINQNNKLKIKNRNIVKDNVDLIKKNKKLSDRLRTQQRN